MRIRNKMRLEYVVLILQLTILVSAQKKQCNSCNNRPDPCSPNPCSNSGNCHSSDGSSFSCTCAPSFTGLRCESRVYQMQANNDMCQFRPCLNGGTCININQPNINPPYACVCPSTMTGSRCEVAVQPHFIIQPTTQRQTFQCNINPCASGSTCISNTQTTMPTCVCPPNRTGNTCNQLITNPPVTTTQFNPCIGNPCNFGQCVSLGFSFRCQCPPNFTGLTCNQQVTPPPTTTQFNPCLQNPCNFGQCFSLGSSFRCQCPPNFTGLTCNQQVTAPPTTPFNPCAQNPCQTGQCINQINTFRCQCPQGFTGARCESRDPCSFNPCQSSGTCVPMSNAFACICNPFYTGSRCEIYVGPVQPTQAFNPCSSNPCSSGGACSMINTVVYSCNCRPQFTGFNCQHRIESLPTLPPGKQYQPNACSSSPCFGSSTCIGISQPFVNPPYACICPPNFTGARCDQPLIIPNQLNCNQCTQVATTTTTNPCFQCNPVQTTPTTTTTRLTTTTTQNPCQNNPCQSGGTCRPAISTFSFSCLCPNGFTGARCDQVDLCASPNTCYNGGTCQTQRTGQDQYTVSCTCLPSFTGSRCQIPITNPPVVITPSPQICQCVINGLCQQNCQQQITTTRPPIQNNCQCIINGLCQQNCQQQITTTRPPIQNNCQCQNNGICQPTGACQCQNNFFGNNCQYRMNTLSPEAASLPQTCPSGLCVQGVCAVIPQGGASYCICNFGWIGPRCNIRNYCQSNTNPCLNGGSCVNGQNSFKCICDPKFTGSQCEVAVVRKFNIPGKVFF